tara:strand:- start:1220 stop:1705 length:486 start_codon:yes stop_codon:yes gene_type:complete
MSNTFTQLVAANNSGDYLSLKKSKNIYNIDNSKTKINNKKVVRTLYNNFESRLLFNKGQFQNIVCTKNTVTRNIMQAALTLSANSSTVDNFYKGKTIRITAGSGNGESKTIESYNGTTKVITVDSDFTTATDNTSVYTIFLDNSTFPYTNAQFNAENKIEF